LLHKDSLPGNGQQLSDPMQLTTPWFHTSSQTEVLPYQPLTTLTVGIQPPLLASSVQFIMTSPAVQTATYEYFMAVKC
jgi:hypothetical protein